MLHIQLKRKTIFFSLPFYYLFCIFLIEMVFQTTNEKFYEPSIKGLVSLLYTTTMVAFDVYLATQAYG